MEKPYLLMSDLHFHSWSAFSSVEESGENSRLRIIIKAFESACLEFLETGGDTCYIAGDLFHVRGSIAPSVLNPVRDSFHRMMRSGLKFRIIPGNHDLETKQARRLTNASQTLEEVGCVVVYEPQFFEDDNVLMVSWIEDLNELKAVLKKWSSTHDTSHTDLIIHAPMNNVLVNIPDTGLTPDELSEFGFKRVFCGHYHNARRLDHGCFSIGALTHQVWSDVNTKAGYWHISDDSEVHYETQAPKFIDVDLSESDFSDDYAGNYIRVKMGEATESEIAIVRANLSSELGAAGCIVQAQPVKSATREAVVESAESINDSLLSWIKQYGDKNVDHALLYERCAGIIDEIETVG